MDLTLKDIVVSILLATLISVVGVTLCHIAAQPNVFTQEIYDTHKDVGRK